MQSFGSLVECSMAWGIAHGDIEPDPDRVGNMVAQAVASPDVAFARWVRRPDTPRVWTPLHEDVLATPKLLWGHIHPGDIVLSLSIGTPVRMRMLLVSPTFRLFRLHATEMERTQTKNRGLCGGWRVCPMNARENPAEGLDDPIVVPPFPYPDAVRTLVAIANAAKPDDFSCQPDYEGEPVSIK
jgi:hypothetical protein